VTPRGYRAEPPPVLSSEMRVALTFEKVGDEWKLLREGPAADDLALSLIHASNDAERDAFLAAEPDLLGAQLFTALARQGGAAAAKQDYVRAQAIFELVVRYARQSGFKKEEGEALQNIANGLYFRRQFPEALAVYEQRLVLERGRQDDTGIAAALGGIATVRYSLAEYTEALERYREALAIHERQDDVAGVAFTTLSVGNIAYLQGDFQTAIAAYRRSLDLNRSMHHVDGESRAQEGLGLVYTAQGDFAAALDALDGILKDERMQSYRGRLGAVAQSAGDVHFRLGNLDVAKKLYEDSRAHFESLKDMANVGRVLQSAALVELVAGRFVQAEEGYKRSGSICTAVEDGECIARATAGLGYAQAAQEKFWDAAGSYRKAVDQFSALGRGEDAARAEIGLAQALMGTEDFAGAIGAASRSRLSAAAISNDDVLWRALTAEARAVRKLGDQARALGVARAAAGVLDRMQAEAIDKPGARLPADASAAFATFAILQAEAGDAPGAFATTEKMRMLEIRGRLAVNERDIARGMTAADREEERALSAQLATLLARLSREKGLPKPDASRIAALEKDIEQARGARAVFLQRLFETLPDLRVWRGLAPSRTAPDAAPLLDVGTVLLSLVMDDDDLLVFALSRTVGELESDIGAVGNAGAPAAAEVAVEAHVVPIRRRQLGEHVAALQRPAALGDLGAWRKAAAEIVALLPPAVMQRLETASRVMIIPHDVLWRLPFEALPTGEGLLIDRATVRVGASLDALLRAIEVVPSMNGGTLMVGAPVLAPARSERLKQTAPSWPLREADHTELELTAAAAGYRAEDIGVRPRGAASDRVGGIPAAALTLSGAAATEGKVREAAAVAPLLHVAAPFRINAASPLFSPILLSMPEAAGAQQSPQGGASSSVQGARPAPPAVDASDDGALELREIMNLHLGAGVAVLSDGAAMSMRDGAAAAGIVEWGWLAAGVPSLIVARWTSLEGAPGVLEGFHR
ncbi:MAG: tetratricopeptide repeat protein, partial [Vicinamibacterales bacterium]